MKKIALFTSISFLIFLSSCGGDDDPVINPLVSGWKLASITISEPPSGYSFELFNLTPNSTLYGETNYQIEFKADFAYERILFDASVIDNNGNPLVTNLTDNGSWEQIGNELVLSQESTNIEGLVTRFTINEITDSNLTLEARDSWFAWPPEIANDDEALDTITTNAGFTSLLLEYGEIVEATFTMEFEKD